MRREWTFGYISVHQCTQGIYERWRKATHHHENINLDIEQGEFICLLRVLPGPVRSTLLNAMAGFVSSLPPGSITIDGIEVKAPQLRYVTVFQNLRTVTVAERLKQY